jgi:hypothetical protein
MMSVPLSPTASDLAATPANHRLKSRTSAGPAPDLYQTCANLDQTFPDLVNRATNRRGKASRHSCSVVRHIEHLQMLYSVLVSVQHVPAGRTTTICAVLPGADESGCG